MIQAFSCRFLLFDQFDGLLRRLTAVEYPNKIHALRQQLSRLYPEHIRSFQEVLKPLL